MTLPTYAPSIDAEAAAAWIASAPAAPGVYWMKDRKGRIIYVGKARQYPGSFEESLSVAGRYSAAGCSGTCVA